MKQQYPDFQRQVTHAVCCPILTMKQIPFVQHSVCSYTAQAMWDWIYGKTFNANQEELAAIQQFLLNVEYVNYASRFIPRMIQPPLNQEQFFSSVLQQAERQGQDLMITFAPDHHILLKKHKDIWIIFQSWVNKFSVHQYSKYLKPPKCKPNIPLRQWKIYILWFLDSCLDSKFQYWEFLVKYFQNQAIIHSILIWRGETKSYDTAQH